MIYSRESIESLRLKRDTTLAALVFYCTEKDRLELIQELDLINEELDKRFDGISEELWAELESNDDNQYLKYLQEQYRY